MRGTRWWLGSLTLRATARTAPMAPVIRRLEPRVYTSEPDADSISILDFLLKSEKDGEQYYRDLAANAPNPEIRRIFTLLANEEEKHYRALQQWRGSADAAFGDSNACTLLGTTRSIFEDLRNDPHMQLLSLTDHLALYTEIRNIEARSRDAYLERARRAQDPDVRALLRRMAHEEQKHFLMLDELVLFIKEAGAGASRPKAAAAAEGAAGVTGRSPRPTHERSRY